MTECVDCIDYKDTIKEKEDEIADLEKRIKELEDNIANAKYELER